jgi:heme exporter protein C
MALQAAIDDPRRADRAGALLVIVCVVNVPIIYYSVQWWNKLHQGASVSLTRAPSMAAAMFTGMVLMALAFRMYSIAVSLARVRCMIRERQCASFSPWEGMRGTCGVLMASLWPCSGSR